MKPIDDKHWQETRQQVLIHRQFFRKLYDITNHMHRLEYPPHLWDQIIHDLIPAIDRAMALAKGSIMKLTQAKAIATLSKDRQNVYIRQSESSFLLSTFNDVKVVFLRIEEQRVRWFYLERKPDEED